MRALIPVLSGMGKKLIAESLMLAAKQSSRCQVVPDRLRLAIDGYLREQELGHMKKKVARLRESFNHIKEFNRLLPQSVAKEMVDDPFGSDKTQRWKIKSSYGDSGLTYREESSIAYVASRMPSVFSACFRVLREVRARLPGFSPAKVLDFGSGSGSAFWALSEVWPHSMEYVNLIEPSQSMQRAAAGLLKDVKNMPLIHGYDSILSFTKKVRKTERQHDLVIASYVLGEIPSVKDRISTVRQLWGLTRDILVLIEPGTPEGSHIITQMRAHILWMEKRKTSKRKGLADDNSSEAPPDGAFIVAPCPHDGPCPLVNTGTYCHFVQRVQRTESQIAYKRTGGVSMRGYEDEKFSYVVIRRGKRPQEPWPLDDISFETLKEMKANKQPEVLEIDYEDQFEDQLEDQSDSDEIVPNEVSLVPNEVSPSYDSSATEVDAVDEFKEEAEERGRADLGSGWGRIIFMPQKRGRCVEMDVCRATKRDGSEGSFEHLAITRSKNPALHRQASKSIWGDLWPF